MTSYTFIVIGVYVLLLNRKEKLNILAAIEYFCLTWWSVCYSFIFVAQTAEEAMLWHRLASIGWGLFCPVATHFFILISDRAKTKGSKYAFLLYILPTVIIINAFINPAGTSVASGFMKLHDTVWVYITNIRSLWYWPYLLNITACFSFCLSRLYIWAKNSGKLRFMKQAKSILALNIFVLSTGAFWDLILPAFYPKVPPACHFVALFWAIGFLYIIKALKLTSPEDFATPDIILRTVADPILVLNNKGIVAKCNKGTENVFKLNSEHILGRPLSDFFASGKYNLERVEKIFRGEPLHDIEIDIMDSEGQIINTMASFTLAETKLDGPVGVVASFHDITVLKKIEKELNERNEKNLKLSKQLEVLANYDALTGLPTRRLFLEKVDAAVKEYITSGKVFALFFIDLDGFKSINDLYGHDVGDKLLQRCSEMFKATVRKSDFITRIGGDEFIIFLEQFDELYLEGLIRRLKRAFIEPIEIDGCHCSIGLSLGCSKCPEDGTSGAELIKSADKRMYTEKYNKG